jgi:hypothetical protein
MLQAAYIDGIHSFCSTAMQARHGEALSLAAVCSRALSASCARTCTCTTGATAFICDEVCNSTRCATECTKQGVARRLERQRALLLNSCRRLCVIACTHHGSLRNKTVYVNTDKILAEGHPGNQEASCMCHHDKLACMHMNVGAPHTSAAVIWGVREHCKRPEAEYSLTF